MGVAKVYHFKLFKFHDLWWDDWNHKLFVALQRSSQRQQRVEFLNEDLPSVQHRTLPRRRRKLGQGWPLLVISILCLETVNKSCSQIYLLYRWAFMNICTSVSLYKQSERWDTYHSRLNQKLIPELPLMFIAAKKIKIRLSITSDSQSTCFQLNFEPYYWTPPFQLNFEPLKLLLPPPPALISAQYGYAYWFSRREWSGYPRLRFWIS